jgi:Variant SH3 domain
MAVTTTGGSPRRAYVMKTLYDYDGEDNTELTMRDGELIVVVAEDDSGWFTGVGAGGAGLFPQNFCEELTLPELRGEDIEDDEADGGNDPNCQPEAASAGRHVRLLCDIDSRLLSQKPLLRGTVLRIASVVEGLAGGTEESETKLVMWECTDEATGEEHIRVPPGACRLLPTSLVKSAKKH